MTHPLRFSMLLLLLLAGLSAAAPNAVAGTADGTWSAVPPPAEREGAAAVYDPVRDRMLMFGGNDTNYPLRDEVWVFSFTGSPAWTVLDVTGGPPSGRWGHSMIYDPVRDRVLMFGGSTGAGHANDVWALSLAGSAAWTQLTPSGGPPSARYMHSAIYDPVRDRMLVYGGNDVNFGPRTDLWALSLSGDPEWSFVSAAGGIPAPRQAAAAIYDPVRDRMLMFGGYNYNTGNLGDTWSLSLAGDPTWSQLAPSGPLPTARHHAAAIYDPVNDRMLLFAGLSDLSRHQDVHALALAGSPAWSALTPSGGPPPARFFHTALYDPLRERLVAFGGNAAGTFLNDVWGLSLAGSPAWLELTPAGGPPPGRYAHTAIYDPVRERMIVFGGDANDGTSNGVWALELDGAPVWTDLAPAGTPPTPRTWAAAIYDAPRDRMVLFGGYGGSAYLDEVWALTLDESPVWSQLLPSGTPPLGRDLLVAIYDASRERMVLFGGHDSGGLHGDVWALGLNGVPSWADITPGGGPSPRQGHMGIYDPLRDRMIVHGGWDGNHRSDTWALSLAGGGWTEIIPTGGTVSVRSYSQAIYDPVRDRMVVFGGWIGNGLGNDTWALPLDGDPVWTPLAPAGSPPGLMYMHSTIYDPVADRMIVFGGNIDQTRRRDVWFLDWATVQTSVTPGSDGTRLFALATPRPNPSRGETLVEFDLARPARVTLDVFDAQGRQVRRVADAWYAGGRHTDTWHGDDDRGRAVEAGVYFIRMQAGGAQIARRTVRIR